MERHNFRFFNCGERTKALILSFIGGMLNAFCKDNYGIYSTMQTNNTVTLVSKIVEGNFSEILPLVCIIVSFITGIIFACSCERHCGERAIRRLLFVCAVCIIAVIFVPGSAHQGFSSGFDLVSAGFIGFVSAIMLHSFIKSGAHSYTPTMMTANMNRLMTAFYNRLSARGRKPRYAVFLYCMVFVAFMAGVALCHFYLLRFSMFGGKEKMLYSEDFAYELSLKRNLVLSVPAVLFLFLAFSACRREDSSEGNFSEES